MGDCLGGGSPVAPCQQDIENDGGRGKAEPGSQAGPGLCPDLFDVVEQVRTASADAATSDSTAARTSAARSRRRPSVCRLATTAPNPPRPPRRWPTSR